MAAAQEEAKLLDSARHHAQSSQQELALLTSAHETLQSKLAVDKGRLSAFDESCRHALDRVQTLSAALQEAQQAKVSSNGTYGMAARYIAEWPGLLVSTTNKNVGEHACASCHRQFLFLGKVIVVTMKQNACVW